METIVGEDTNNGEGYLVRTPTMEKGLLDLPACVRPDDFVVGHVAPGRVVLGLRLFNLL